MPQGAKKKFVYLDHAATTGVDEGVLKAMLPYFVKNYGNPSSIYELGRAAGAALASARASIAKNISALPENIIFTAGGTEADNLAIYGIARAHADRGKHIITTAIEHHAVLNPLEDLAKQGWEITYVNVDKNGIVNAKDVLKAIGPDTVLVSVMHANNEVGSIAPIAEIGKAILKYRQENKTSYPYFHTDACQAAGYLDLNVEKSHVDLMAVNGSKICGPKGIGFLYARRGVKIKPLIVGGGQEKRMRSGTENVPAIIGLATALEMARKNREAESKRLRGLVKYFWEKLQKGISKIKLNGPEIGENRLPNNLNVTFMDVEGEAMLLYLDEKGIMCSTGSACTSDSLAPSHVLTALGMPYEMSHGSLRFTFGKENTRADVDYVMEYLPKIVERLREISPVSLGKQAHAKYKK